MTQIVTSAGHPVHEAAWNEVAARFAATGTLPSVEQVVAAVACSETEAAWAIETYGVHHALPMAQRGEAWREARKVAYAEVLRSGPTDVFEREA